MADYAIGLSFHKAHRTIVRAVDLVSPARFFAARDTAGNITLPTLPTGKSYIELQGITQTSFQINDTNQDFRTLGDTGWGDSVITGQSVQASVTAFFLKNAEIPGGQTTPEFRGGYDEGFNLIQRARYDKDYEIYIEFLKELGQASGDTGNYIYDFTGFNAAVMNYQESINSEGLTEVSFDLMSRGKPVFGRYDHGSAAITFGGVQSTLLYLVDGTRQAGVTPADNASSVTTSSNITVAYTSNGSVALSQLSLGQTDGSGFRLEEASTGTRITAGVSLSTNTVTINPTSNLGSGKIYRLVVADGAIMQSVDNAGNASASGTKRPIEGFTSSFRTA